MDTDSESIVDVVVDDDSPTTRPAIKQERCTPLSSTKRHSEEHGARPPAPSERSSRRAAHNNTSRRYDHATHPTSGWLQPPLPPSQQSYAPSSSNPWGYQPNASHLRQNNSYRHYHQAYSNQPPYDGNYERPPFHWPELPAPGGSSGNHSFDDPLPFRPDSRTTFSRAPPTISRVATTREAETPTRSNRGGEQRYHYRQQHRLHHQQHEIQRQLSWEDLEYSHPLPARRDSIGPPSLQRLHHHQRESDIFDMFARPGSYHNTNNGSSHRQARSSPSEIMSLPYDEFAHGSRSSSVLAEEVPASASVSGPFTGGNRASDGLIREVRPEDVLCGRGIQTADQPGNLYLRELVQKRQIDYLASVRNQKSTIAMEIMDKIRGKGGRFLKRISVRKYEAPPGGEAWEAMEEKQIYDKVCQALREGAPRIRQKMLAMAKSTTGGHDGAEKENSSNRTSV